MLYITVRLFTGPESGNEKGVTIFTFLRFWQPFVKHMTSIACYESQDCKTLLLTSITCQLVDMSTLFLHCSSVWHSNEKPRITFWGGQSGASEKKVHHLFEELGPHFDECIAFPEKRASPFSKNVHHFFKNVQHFCPKCESPTSRIAQDFEKPSIRQILHDSCWIQLHWGKKGQIPAALLR